MSTRSEPVRARRPDVVAATVVALFVAVTMAITAAVASGDTETPSTTSTRVSTTDADAIEPGDGALQQTPRFGDASGNTPSELNGGLSFGDPAGGPAQGDDR
jgi:hypothetical protein